MSARAQIGCLVITDMLVWSAAGALSWGIKLLEDPALPTAMYVQAMPFVIIGMTAIHAGLGLYPVYLGSAESLRRLTYGSTCFVGCYSGDFYIANE